MFWIGGMKLSKEEKKQFARIEMRSGISALLLGMFLFVLNVETNRHYLHDSVAIIHVFFASVTIIVLYLLFQVRYLVAMRIREDLSRKENKNVA